VTFPRRLEPINRPFESLLERGLRALRRHGLRRANACVRCGRPYSTNCQACGAKVCDRCWILSIETGAPAILCLDCTQPSRARPPEGRLEAAETFRSGARTLALVIVAIGALSYWQHGWAGPWRVAALLLQPSITLGLVPLAFLIGAVRIAAVRALGALLKDRSSS
jgi:hypothetical protein